jgi:hypothetical protein
MHYNVTMESRSFHIVLEHLTNPRRHVIDRSRLAAVPPGAIHWRMSLRPLPAGSGRWLHFFNAAIQFRTTVIGVDVSGSAGMLIKKRPSAAMSYGKKL